MKRLELQPYTALSKRFELTEKHVAELPEFDLEKFVFELPLYRTVKFSSGDQIRSLLGRIRSSVDGYCNECGRETVFHPTNHELSSSEAQNLPPVLLVQLQCQRRNHILSIAVNFEGATYKEDGRAFTKWVGQIEKIGQSPSHADISIGELGRYKGVLKGKDRAEFVRAIGLAANGVYIGAFVYLRRLFERLVDRARQRAGDSLNQNAYQDARMSEKIALLKDFLPHFLVENRKIYSVLSKGVHELEEDTCGRYFPIMRESCLLMLEQEKELTERESLEQSLTQAITAIK